ncbi:MAG: putative 2-hydroxyacid dehydrogenase [Deltaproteobacteria bacterium ADurb.Bin510]|nr:MAG: putative 2-hydroxyacid dehydrogenase [Deltaproteobacteria bacterium ADurb.Bin510]
MAKILITRKLPGSALARLHALAELDIWTADSPMPRGEILRRIADCDGLLCLLTDRIDREVIAAAPKLKIIANYAVGYDNIDVNAARERGIMVANTPGVLTEATADLAWALLMAAARLVPTGDRLVRSGRWAGWDPNLLLGASVFGQTLGIVGAGRIGTAVALRSGGFKMNVVYTSRRPNEILEDELGARRLELEELLAQADFVSLHLPLTAATRHLIGPRELKMMKPGAVLINTARGPVVDEAALAQALQDGPLAAAGLDVFENEPAVNPALLDLPNVVLLPHLGSATLATRSRMADIAAANLIAWIQGRVAPNCVFEPA